MPLRRALATFWGGELQDLSPGCASSLEAIRGHSARCTWQALQIAGKTQHLLKKRDNLWIQKTKYLRVMALLMTRHPTIDFPPFLSITLIFVALILISPLSKPIWRPPLQISSFSPKTSVYRKKTYTGARINYISHVYHNYKMSAFSTFLNRAWRLSNDYLSFHKELEVLRTYSLSNGYPEKIFYKKVRNFMNNVFDHEPKKQTAQKENIYI